MSKSYEDSRQHNKRIEVFGDVTVTRNDTETGKIETMASIHAIAFHCTVAGVGATRTQMTTDIEEIAIKLNSKVIRKMTAAQVLDLYKHYKDDMGAFTPEGILPIEFSLNAFDLAQVNNEYALGMMDPSDSSGDTPLTLTYSIKYKDVAMTITKIQVRAIVDDRKRFFGRHIRITPHTRGFTGTDDQEITDLPKNVGSKRLLAYHFVLGTGVISEITVKQGTDEIYDQAPRELMEFLLNNAGRKPQAGYFHLPFNLGNDPRSGLELVNGKQHLVQPKWSTTPGGNYSILEESEFNGL